MLADLIIISIFGGCALAIGWSILQIAQAITVGLGYLAENLDNELKSLYNIIRISLNNFRKRQPMSFEKKSVVVEALFDTILTLATKRAITNDQAKSLCRKIAHSCGLPELLP